MQRKNSLPSLGLHRDRLAIYLRTHPDRLGVGRIVFIANIERLDELRRHQLNLMPHLNQPSRPML
jgi:hypothetical protein